MKSQTLRMCLAIFCLNLLMVELSAQPAFTDVTVLKGITSMNPILPLEHDGGDVIDVFNIGSGAAFLDFNSDGFLDIYITMRNGANRLYRNNGPSNYNFTEVAGLFNIQDISGDGSGVAVADFDNDGDPDIYICNSGVDRFFRNDGTTFTDITGSAGLSLTNESRSTSASWGDYDQDGYLDLYIARYDVFPGNNGTRQDRLYHNDGDGTFTEVSSLLDVSLLMGPAFIGSFVDFDNDGDLDIIVINDCDFYPEEEGRTRIFRNDGGTDPVNDWTFTEVAAIVGVDDCSNGMGISIGDINHDGFQEFANSDIGAINFWLNDQGVYSDIATTAGVDNQDAGHYSWGMNLFDHNNDGWLDLFLVSGSLQHSSNVDPQPNYFYENNAGTGETFTDISAIIEMNDVAKGRNSITGDYDNDGDLDVFIINYNEAVMLKQNNNSGNNWIKVKLTGVFDVDGAGFSNKDGIGAKVKVTTPDGITQTVETRSGSSLGGGDQIIAHFGLGSNTVITELKIDWPCGQIQTIDNITTVNTTLSVTETPDGPLAVDLIHFEAEKDAQDVQLEWSTAAEINNAFFNIQRSRNGRVFENIGQVEGQGNTTNLSDYIFVDKTPFDGDNYYRLEQTDFDGKTAFSDIRYIRMDKPVSSMLKVSPNPVTADFIELTFNTPDEKIQLTILDVLGNIIFQENIIQNGQASSRSISRTGLASGMYFISISGQSGQLIEKVNIR